MNVSPKHSVIIKTATLKIPETIPPHLGRIGLPRKRDATNTIMQRVNMPPIILSPPLIGTFNKVLSGTEPPRQSFYAVIEAASGILRDCKVGYRFIANVSNEAASGILRDCENFSKTLSSSIAVVANPPGFPGLSSEYLPYSYADREISAEFTMLTKTLKQ